MTTIERAERPSDEGPAVEVGIRADDGVWIVDTTELRWFSDGEVPPTIMSWFNEGDTLGTVEARSDIYRVDGRTDVGVKRRFRETLELKVRRGIEEPLHLHGGLAGPLEVWRRWSPAGQLVIDDDRVPWVEVHKVVHKRRFSADGVEVELIDNATVIAGSGCDVEIVAVTIENTNAWSLAFASYGPPETRRSTLVSCWRALASNMEVPKELESCFGRSSGYPEWLSQQSLMGWFELPG